MSNAESTPEQEASPTDARSGSVRSRTGTTGDEAGFDPAPLFAIVPAPLILTDAQGLIRELNASAGDLLGLSRAEASTTSLVARLQMRDRTHVHPMVQRAARDGSVHHVDAELRGDPGRAVRMSISGTREGTVLWHVSPAADLPGTLADRESRLIDLLSECIPAIGDDPDGDISTWLGRMLERLCEGSGIDACAVLLTLGDQVMVAAASNPAVEEVELAQVRAGAGPSLEALRGGQPVIDDLAVLQERWPTFVAACHARQFRSIAAFPWSGADGSSGSFTAYGEHGGGLAPGDLHTCRALARILAPLITTARLIADHHSQATHLRRAMDSRVVVEQAKGMIAQARRVDLDMAFGLLRRAARRRDLQLHVLAADVVAGRTDPLALDGSATGDGR